MAVKLLMWRFLPLVLSFFALGLVRLESLPWLQSFGWWFLSIQLPGILLLLLIAKKEDDLPPLELWILGGAIGYAIATIVMLAVSFTIYPITANILLVIIGGITIALSGWVAIRQPNRTKDWLFKLQVPRTVSAWFGTIIVLFLIITHLAGLGYSEYQGDELDAIEPSWSILAGEPAALLSHHRGPTQSLVATSFARTLDGYPEGPLRLPYALAGLGAAGALYLLTRHLFGRRTALIALALYCLEGLTIGFSRILQYQGILFLVQLAPLICFVRFSEAKHSQQARRWLMLGAFLLGYAYLTHYEALFIGLVSLPLLWRGRHNLSGKARWGWGLATFIFLLMVVYYIPFITATSFSDTAAHYRTNRIGLTDFPHNNLNRLVAANLFYNSMYYFLLVSVGALIGLWLAVRLSVERSWWAWTFILTFIVGLVILIVGGKEASTLLIITGVAISLPATLIIIFGPRVSVAYRLVGIWLFSYWLTYNFLISAPDLHFYELVAPWIIWAAIGFNWLFTQLPARLVRPAAVAGALLWAFMAVYPLMAFVMVEQEMLLTFSESSPLRWWTSISQRATSVAMFGVPHREGWRAIGTLYRDGTLSGDYKSNGGNVVPRWYIGASSSSSELPTYLFATDQPFRQSHQAEIEPILATGRYQLISELRATDRMVQIYQLDASVKQNVVQRDLANLTDRYKRSFDLDEAIAVRDQAIFWDSAARFVTLFASPGSAIGVCPPTALPLLATSVRSSPKFEPGCSNSNWQIRGGENLRGENGWLFGKVEVIPPPNQTVSGPFQTNFEAGIQLVGSKITPNLETNQVTIHFAWSRWAPATAPRDYTVFVHLVDEEGNLVAQSDREIEVGDRKLWQREVGEIVDDPVVLSLPEKLPVGTYPLVIGLYYWETGERLATISPAGEPGDTFLWLGDLILAANSAKFRYAGTGITIE